MSLDCVTQDILSEIIVHLSFVDIIQLRCVSKEICAFTQRPTVYKQVCYKRHRYWTTSCEPTLIEIFGYCAVDWHIPSIRNIRLPIITDWSSKSAREKVYLKYLNTLDTYYTNICLELCDAWFWYKKYVYYALVLLQANVPLFSLSKGQIMMYVRGHLRPLNLCRYILDMSTRQEREMAAEIIASYNRRDYISTALHWSTMGSSIKVFSILQTLDGVHGSNIGYVVAENGELIVKISHSNNYSYASILRLSLDQLDVAVFRMTGYPDCAWVHEWPSNFGCNVYDSLVSYFTSPIYKLSIDIMSLYKCT